MLDIFDSLNIEEESILKLRPETLDDYIGQDKIKDSLRIYIKSSLIQNKTLDHILLYGPPGLGKTTLSKIIAFEMQKNIKTTTGPSISSISDLITLLADINEGDFIFIDEIHRIPSIVEEVLYSALEDFKIDIIIGKDNSSKAITIDLPTFTLVGATTRIGDLSSPLRDRFGIIYHLEFYNNLELKKIIKRNIKLLNVDINDEAINLIATNSRGTPRICNRLLKRVSDYAVVLNNSLIDINIINKCFFDLGIIKDGLDDDNILYLKTLIYTYNKGPVGIDAIARQLNLDKNTIEDFYEPYLLKEGYIKRSSRGRIATEKALKLFM